MIGQNKQLYFKFMNDNDIKIVEQAENELDQNEVSIIEIEENKNQRNNDLPQFVF